MVFRKNRLKCIIPALLVCGCLLSGCGLMSGLPSIVEDTADVDLTYFESSDNSDMPYITDSNPVPYGLVPEESSVSASESGKNSLDNSATNSGGGVLAPSTVLSLSAGCTLMDESIDWNLIESYFAVKEIHEGDAIYNRIIGKSYRVNDDIGLSELRYLKLLHYNFDGNIQVGELICNTSLAEDMIDIFKELFNCKYQIRSMHLIDNYWTGDGVESDEASIEVDNTSCFCYRRATDAENLSNHAYGRAIDINPLENPFYIIRPDGSLEYYHTNAEPYLLNRDPSIPHVITEVDDAYRIFTAHGFSWGGSWSNPKDYQHFEKLT